MNQLPGLENTPAPKKRGNASQGKIRAENNIQTELMKHVPPNSAEAELAVLGGILMRPDLMDLISDILSPDDFYIPANKIIYNSFLELHSNSSPIDLLTIAEYLRNHKQLETIGGSVYLGQISQAIVTGANAEYYAQIVRNKAMQRNLIDACAAIISNARDSSRDINEILDESEQAILSVSRRSSKKEFSHMTELTEDVIDHLSRLADAHDVVTGVTTGFDQLDTLTAGMQNSDLIIVAARPSMGKTAFALCVALNAALKQQITVGIFSLEMSREQLIKRLLSMRGSINLKRLRSPAKLTNEDWANLHQAAGVISKAPIYIDDSSVLSTLELRAKARRLKAEHGLGLLIIDYLQLMKPGRKTDSRELEISDISRSLKALAKELDIPVMALSQLNRMVENRPDKRPILADLRESGAIEQDADVIMFVYRDDVYKFKKPSDRPLIGDAEIIIGKQRNGPVGIAELVYHSEYTSFNNRSPYDYTPPPRD